MDEIVLKYREWILTITDTAAIAISADGERFECHRQPSAEDALRVAKAKVERLEGPQVWNENYEREALR